MGSKNDATFQALNTIQYNSKYRIISFCGVMVSMLALQLRGPEFDPLRNVKKNQGSWSMSPINWMI